MKRVLILFVALAATALAAMACNLTGAGLPTSTPASNGGGNSSASGAGTIIAATSSIPTATSSAAISGNTFPSGTLILSQRGNGLAQAPNANGKTIALPTERYGSQASPDGHYGVRFKANGGKFDLLLIDFSTANDTGKAIPQGSGLSSPAVAWKRDSSGFAFYDFPASGGSAGIQYYDVSSSQTKNLIPAQSGNVVAALSFSPDGKLLAYSVNKAGAEGTTGPDSKLFIFDTSSSQSTPLPAGTFGFAQWLRDNSGFIVRQPASKSPSVLSLYQLTTINTPKALTPTTPNTTDFLVSISPDGKYIVVSSAAVGNASIANIYMMNLDGSNRKPLTQFASTDQTITGLVWGTDGIYYSISSASNQDTTWRMDLDGNNAAQVAQGTLLRIVGIN